MSSIEVNQEAPDFEIEDFKGNKFKLSSFRGKSNVLIVLNRGFVWPFCKKHMMQLHQDYDKFAEKDTVIVAIGPENSKNFKTYWEENSLKFYGIPDDKQSVLKLYGQKINIFKLGRMPAQMIVDKAGMLRYLHYGNSMKDIPENSEIFELIDTF